MKKIINLLSILIVCICFHKGNSVNIGLNNKPLVYVVTPSPRSLQIDEGRSAPFYYHNWMRRMDSPQNVTTTTVQPTEKVKTPDLIFAEFESDNGDNMRKSIRKLLEKEKIKTETTTSKPIYVPDETNIKDINEEEYYRFPPYTNENDVKIDPTTPDMTDYFGLNSNVYDNGPAPVYTPSTTPSATTKSTRVSTSTPMSVKNIWHIIDNEKHNPNLHSWNEVPINPNENQQTGTNAPNVNEQKGKGQDDQMIDDNFAIPGFGTFAGNGAENESRAIRTEPNMRFPYVNLKPFQMKNFKKPSPSSNNKNANSMFSLDNFQDIKHPVRGEAQDVVVPMRQPIDRYNPAQPYLPSPPYGSKSKQSVPDSTPVKTVANLVPPPPPLPPKVTGNDFPALTSYESFPPYNPSNSFPDTALPPTPSYPAAAPKPTLTMMQPPVNIPDSSDSDSGPVDDGPPMDLGYRYKPPSQVFVPTLPPAKKPFKGYSYDKPVMTAAMPPMSDTYDKPDFQGYHYDKPEPPSPPEVHAPSHFGYDNHHESHHHPHHEEQDYSDLIFSKPHGDMDDAKGNDMKGNDDSGMGMMPPPPPPDMGDMKPDMGAGPPMDDHGFPDDFPGNFKYNHHFDDDDHDFYHYHHHHPTTTTTTTTEMPRVNRFSYYYLGKKLYYLPLYFSVYFIIYVGALVIKAILRHKIVYPNSFRPNDQTAGFFSKRSVDSWDLSKENLHEITGKITHAIGQAAEKYLKKEN